MSADVMTFTMEGEKSHLVKVEILETVKGIKRVSRKEINFYDFLKILNESRTVEGLVPVGKLPEGYYDGNIDINSNGLECLIVLPEGIKPLIYHNKVYTIPFPALLFFFKVQEGRITTSQVHALKKGKVTDKDCVYLYPFGNVHSKGSICWGHNTVDGISSFRELEKAISMFFGSPTNDDLWNKERINVSGNDSRIIQRGLIESLVGQNEFPLELLVDSGIRVGDILASCGKDY